MARAPLRIPGLIGNLVAIGIEPGCVLLHEHQAAIGASADFAILEEFTPVQVGMSQAQLDDFAGELAQALPAVVEIPVEPGEFVVLAVAVVVALLRARYLVAARVSMGTPCERTSAWQENCASGARAGH